MAGSQVSFMYMPRLTDCFVLARVVLVSVVASSSVVLES